MKDRQSSQALSLSGHGGCELQSSTFKLLRNLALAACEYLLVCLPGQTRSQSCPFCRNNLKRVNSGDLWIFMDNRDVVDMFTVTRENLRRLFLYIDKLPLVVPDNLLETYDSHLR